MAPVREPVRGLYHVRWRLVLTTGEMMKNWSWKPPPRPALARPDRDHRDGPGRAIGAGGLLYSEAYGGGYMDSALPGDVVGVYQGQATFRAPTSPAT